MSRYLFETRHCPDCGQQISIHDTGGCHTTEEPAMEKPTKALKSLRRLLRRAAIRGHRPWLVIYTHNQAIALFAGRIVRVRDDGSYVQDMLVRHMPDGCRRADPCWSSGFYNRLHAQEMTWAAETRRRRWHRAGRETLTTLVRLRKAQAA